jgi:hypothetical protein
MDYLKKNDMYDLKVEYYGHTRSFSQAGSALSALFAGLIVYFSGNYNYIFILSIIPYLLNLVLVSTYPDYLNRKKSGKQGYNIIKTIKMFISDIKKPVVLKIINISALHSAYISATKDYIQTIILALSAGLTFLSQTELEKKNGILTGVIYFFIFMINSTAARKSSKFISKKYDITIISLYLGLFMGILTGIFYNFDLYLISLLSFISVFFIENIRKPILTAYVSNNVSGEILTSVLSAQSLLKTFMTSLIALMFGITADYFGVAKSFVIVSIVLLLLSLSLLIKNK